MEGDIYSFKHFKFSIAALTSVAQLVGHCPAKEHVAGSNPGFFRAKDWLSAPRMEERQPINFAHTDVCLPLSFLPFPLCKNK